MCIVNKFFGSSDCTAIIYVLMGLILKIDKCAPSISDIDECAQTSGVCGNGTCVNTGGSYKCSCHIGFRLDRRGVCQGEINTLRCSAIGK